VKEFLKPVSIWQKYSGIFFGYGVVAVSMVMQAQSKSSSFQLG